MEVKRVHRALEWAGQPSRAPRFAALYFAAGAATS